jgi:LacI family repressor for deo operon, udp, cdd, tsx, nupC, and nupG
MDERVRKPRIDDVARLAGVSTATVSRALATPDQVKPTTRAAVARAVQETGYVLNLAARNLRTRRTRAVLAVVPDVSNVFFTQVLRGISDTLHLHGYRLVIADTGNDARRERDHAEFAQAGWVDGLLLLNGRLLSPASSDARPAAIPTVSLCERITGSDLPLVETANRDAARDMTEHLLQLGHRRVGYVAGPAGNILERDRFAGYRDALAAHAIDLDPSLILPGDYTLGAGEAAAAAYLSLPELPDAVFASNDAMAMGLIRGFAGAGLSVPDAISIAGFDDIEFAAAYNPALTTMRQERNEIGVQATRMLIDLIEGREPTSLQISLPAAIVKRNSTRSRR